MPEQPDAATRLETKLDAMISTLDDGELAVLHGLVHLAAAGGEVEGFAFNRSPLDSGDPCEGGEIFDQGTLVLLGNLNAKLGRRHPRPFPPIITA
jgi:hypothetical protein